MLQDIVTAARQWQVRQRELKPLYDAYVGKRPVAFMTEDFQRKFSALVHGAGLNVCRPVVDAFTDDLTIRGWDGDTLTTEQVEQLSALSKLVTREKFRTGDAFAIAAQTETGIRVWFQPAGSIIPTVDAERPDRLRHAVKFWLDERGFGCASLYTASTIERYQTREKLVTENESNTFSMPFAPADWLQIDEIAHGFDCVPVLWWKQTPDDHVGYGRSIITDLLPVQDRVNRHVADILIVSEAYSRPLYWVVGMQADAPVAPAPNPLAGVPTNGLTPDPSGGTFNPTRQQILAIDGQGPVGQFTPADIEKLVTAKTDAVTDASMVSGLPPFYFQLSGDVPSGESLKVLSARRAAVVSGSIESDTPVWRGLASLLGLSATPVFAPVITGSDPNQPA